MAARDTRRRSRKQRRASSSSPGARWLQTATKSPPIPARARPNSAPARGPMRRPIRRRPCPPGRPSTASWEEVSAMRIVHLLVIGALVFAAAYVYRIKMESTERTERVLRLRAQIREERDAIAVLRAEWAKLDSPLRLQGLAERHLPLKPLTATQYDSLKNLPDRPPNYAKSGDPDPIGAMIDAIDQVAV